MQRQIADSEEIQLNALNAALKDCLLTYGASVIDDSTKPVYNETLKQWFCPAYWDQIVCWPITPANTVAVTKCPSYIVGFDKPMNNATRNCMNDGLWFVHEGLNKYWTNYTQCFGSDEATVLVDLSDDLSKLNGTLIVSYLPLLKTIPRIGYTISLCTLVVAFAIMFSIKKLHCPRNNLHMNLFLSFIFRAFVSLLKDLIFVDGVGLSSNLKHKNGETFFFVDKQSNNWSCKLVTSLWEFFITANYSWILMEGLYLHNLIFRALFTDSNNGIAHYIILGWGLPVLVIVPWIITRVMTEDTFCWTTHKDKKTFLIIQIPTTISILINTVLFIRIAKVLFIKLRSTQSEEAKRYRKWAKSTLVLVPLFGIHYAVFLGMWYYMGHNEIIELTWLIFDQLFASFQGCFVAVLYCFLNGEVRTELKPHIHLLYTYLVRAFCCCCKCGEDDFKTIRSRSSVCTMMSSTSLYNGSSHHRHKSRWDCLHHPKHSSFIDKNKEHICRSSNRSWNDISPRRSLRFHGGQYSSIKIEEFKQQNYYSNGSIPVEIAEVTTCLDCQNKQERCKSEPHLGIELTSMISHDR